MTYYEHIKKNVYIHFVCIFHIMSTPEMKINHGYCGGSLQIVTSMAPNAGCAGGLRLGRPGAAAGGRNGGGGTEKLRPGEDGSHGKIAMLNMLTIWYN